MLPFPIKTANLVLKKLSFISAQITIRQLLAPRKVKFRNAPDMKSVFLDNDSSATFFAPTWAEVTEQVIETLKPQPNITVPE